MTFIEHGGLLLGRSLLLLAFALAILIPAWWLAGRIQDEHADPFFRLLVGIGLSLVGYLTFVNLLGRLLHQSIVPMVVYLAFSVALSLYLWGTRREEVNPRALVGMWRSWLPLVGVVLLLAIPQFLAAISTPFYDEVASSAIHITGPNQFAEGIFPPRHNALPDIAIKYHYGSIILSGTVRWVTSLTTNSSIDVVSTFLWIFAFLFVYAWLRQLAFGKFASFWGGFTLLLGGGLSWIYQRRVEAYEGISKAPQLSEMRHKFDPLKSFFGNVLANGDAPSLYLRNADGSLSNLPWDIAAQFQQHAVALGIPLAVFALYLFVTWQKRPGTSWLLFVANVLTFAVLFLGHAVFGTVSAVAAGLYLLGSWVRHRTRPKFLQGLFFGVGVGVIAFLHGGLLSRGDEYGLDTPTTFRHTFGYFLGGLEGFLHWNLAGFGVPLILALVAGLLHLRFRDPKATERNLLFTVLVTYALFSYLVPQVMYYSSGGAEVEQYTEISKFFFTTHFAIALLSVFGIAYLAKWVPWQAMAPVLGATAIVPLAFIYAASFKPGMHWRGFYRSPYFLNSVERHMGDTLQRLKQSNHETYFDASADERRSDYLNELLIFSGSVFTLTPSRYERTGIGYRLSEAVVAKRFVQNSRMMRLLPGAPEDCGCRWYYTRPAADMAFVPVIVRSRFDKLVAESVFVRRYRDMPRELYSIDRPTLNLDAGIENYWHPHVVLQSHAQWNRPGSSKPIFYDYGGRAVIEGGQTIALPEWLKGEFATPYSGRFTGDSGVSLLFGRMKDTHFSLGKRIEDVQEWSGYGWTYRSADGKGWEPEFNRWLWDWDIPVVADLDHDGFDSQLAYRPRTGEWLLAPSQVKLSGPKLDEKSQPVPFAGRFLEGSAGDLGLWSLAAGTVTLKSLSTGRTVSFTWGGHPGDVLVPGDYDGDGYDEMAVWQRTNQTWYWRHAEAEGVSQAKFGTITSVPIPADYNHDGRLDLAYWEPREGKIYVSYDHGHTIGMTMAVPPHSIPAFVNMQ